MIDGLRVIITNSTPLRHRSRHTIIIIIIIITIMRILWTVSMIIKTNIVSNIHNHSKKSFYCPIPETMKIVIQSMHHPHQRPVVMIFCTFTSGHQYIVSPMSSIGLSMVLLNRYRWDMIVMEQLLH